MYEDEDEDGREEDEEMLIRLYVGAAPFDTMFLYNLTVNLKSYFSLFLKIFLNLIRMPS